MVKFKDFSRPFSVFQVLFKANLIFKDFSRQSCIFKYFSNLCEPCFHMICFQMFQIIQKSFDSKKIQDFCPAFWEHDSNDRTPRIAKFLCCFYIKLGKTHTVISESYKFPRSWFLKFAVCSLYIHNFKFKWLTQMPFDGLKINQRLQGSHRNSKTQFHDFSMIFHDQQCNFHDYLIHGLQPPF